jgi:O-antigen ligase
VNQDRLEKVFAIFALLFFTKTLEFRSLFATSEGASFFVENNVTNPLDSLLSPCQHGIFIITLLLLILRWQRTIIILLKDKSLVLLIIICLISFLWSQFPGFTFNRSLSLLETTSFGVYLASRYSLREQLYIVASSFGISLVIHIIFTLILPRAGIEFGKHAGAWRGTLEHKNYFGRLMVLEAIVFRMFVPETKRQSVLINSGFIISLILILLSTSKTAQLTILILLVGLLPIYKSLRWHFRYATIFQVSSLLLGIGFGGVLIGNLDNIQKYLGRDLTLTGRTEIWAATIQKIQERPWLGYGYQGFWHGQEGPSSDILKFLSPGSYVPHSHNGFIELALVTGYLGCLVLTISLLKNFRHSLILARLTSERNGLWPLMYLSFLVLYNQTEMTLLEHNSIFWVLYVAIALSEVGTAVPTKPSLSSPSLYAH